MKIVNYELQRHLERVFLTAEGKKAFSVMSETVSELGMTELIEKGVAVGFSGGADSMLLLLYLSEFRRQKPFALHAIHINHMIRGAEADRDECFCREIAELIEIPFSSVSFDVPSIARARGKGIEECARDLRYEAFESLISSDGKLSSIAVAHNATDNLETVIFNLMRGAGSRGLGGIAPVRGNIIRPMIRLSKQAVVAALNASDVPYMTDSTNIDTEYTRNYIRHSVIPTLSRLSTDPEGAVSRACANIRMDVSFIDQSAERMMSENCSDGRIGRAPLRDAHPALFAAVIRLLAKKSGSDIEHVHINAIRERLLAEGNFSVDIPGTKSFVCIGEDCFIAGKEDARREYPSIPKTELCDGINIFEDHGFAILLSNNKMEVFSSNVYNFSIQVSLHSAIIDGSIFVRSKTDGDSYYYGGMTRKLKKLFNGKKIPECQRGLVPVVCDKNGILWVEGFGVRDDGVTVAQGERKWLTLYKINKDVTK